ncbi:hypothetical protein HDV02_006571 [Globomyces sp. JEL0801]|nr:hypothetical protein HDV02_006571 [Globomyces sp. JEL0801]
MVESDADLKEMYEGNASTLYLISEPKKRLTKFRQLKHGERYGVFSPIVSKTVYIRDVDEDYKPLDSYTEVVVESDADLKEIYGSKGSALYLISEPKKRLTKFRQLKDGEKYGVFSPITSKTIYIRDIDEEFKPLDSYTEVVVESDADLKEIYESKASALYLIGEPNKQLTKFRQLKDGERYGVFSRYERSFSDEVRWQQKEDAAMEEEVALALKNYLHSHLGSTVIDIPTDVFVSKGNIVQEWDAAFKVDDVLYLCEAKHVMSTDKLPKISQRIQAFKEQFQPHAQEQFSIGINKIIGVACATYFPPLVRKEAHELGLICVYPSGWRYRVDKTLPIEFEMKR